MSEIRVDSIGNESNTGGNCGCDEFDSIVPYTDSLTTQCCDSPTYCCTDTNDNG